LTRPTEPPRSAALERFAAVFLCRLFAFSTPASFVFASFEKNFESLPKLYVALKKSKRSRGKLIFVVARETDKKKSPKFATKTKAKKLEKNSGRDAFPPKSPPGLKNRAEQAQEKKERGRK